MLAGVAAPAAVAGALSWGSGSGLAQAWTTSAGTWAVVPMGHLWTRNNTFWQVLFQPAGSSRWSLVTPEGVASNGGLSVESATGAGTSVVVGFQPSIDLRYSPLARTSDKGKHWSPGVLPASLVDVADAVSARPDGTVFALLRQGGGMLVRSRHGTITRWTPVVSEHTLASSAAGRSCGVRALGALAAGDGTVELGAACSARGVVGIFEDAGGTWRLSGPKVVGASAGRSMDVLRLVSGPTGTAALVESRTSSAASLLAMWRSGPTKKWAVSSPVHLTGRVLATDQASNGALAVVVGHGTTAASVLSIAGPHATWKQLDKPPAGTQAVATAGGHVVALADHDSIMDVWQLGPRGWRLSGRFDVPIDYGSST